MYVNVKKQGGAGKIGRLINGKPSGLGLRKSFVIGRTTKDPMQIDEDVHYLKDLISPGSDYKPSNFYFAYHASKTFLSIIEDEDVAKPIPSWTYRCRSFENKFDWLLCSVSQSYTETNSLQVTEYPVLLNVYDAVPRFTHWLDFGLYRSSIEVHGLEFMMIENQTRAGIVMATPGLYAQHKGLKLRECIVVGRTTVDGPDMVKKVAEFVGNQHWFGVLQGDRNSTHYFSSHFAGCLIGSSFKILIRMVLWQAFAPIFHGKVAGVVESNLPIEGEFGELQQIEL